MKTVQQIDDLRTIVANWRAAGLRVGFVPTMGNLHAGHLALIDGALAQADRVVCSIFVNPLQFGPNEDLDAYPRTLAADAEQLAQHGTHLLFTPSVSTMYPTRSEAGHSATVVSVPSLASELCGAQRPGHFDGVATVVSKLFNLVQPDVAFFGRKDFQQLRVIERLATDLAFPIEVVGLPIVRASDGLALSSRNQYLTAAERAIAPNLQQILQELAAKIQQGNSDWSALEQQSNAALAAAGFKPDYLEIRRAGDLQKPQAATVSKNQAEQQGTKPAESAPNQQNLVILAAAWLGKARLLDNIEVSI